MRIDTNSKIKTLKELAAILKSFREEGKKIVLCHGVFDLLHPGHIKHFEAAKRKGNVLAVTVTKDKYVNKGPGRPVFPQQLRAESIAALQCVDLVAINDWPTAVETIKKLRPHYYVKGSDYADKTSDVTGNIREEEAAARAVGGRLYFTDEISFSSSALINAYMPPYPEEAKGFLREFKARYTAGQITDLLKRLRGLKVLVVGDVLHNGYRLRSCAGRNRNGGMVSGRFSNGGTFAGGALTAANQAEGFCGDVTLLGCVDAGKDHKGFISRHLKPGVRTEFHYSGDDSSRPAKPSNAGRLPDNYGLPEGTEKDISEHLDSSLGKFDIVLVTDPGHRLLSSRLIKLLCKKAKFLAVNFQMDNSRHALNPAKKFPHADYICLDEPGIRLICGNNGSSLKQLVLKFSRRLDYGKILISRGRRGSLTYSRKEGFCEIPAFSGTIADQKEAAGACFTLTAPVVFRDIPMELAGFIGNAAGAMTELNTENRSFVEPVPLFRYITALTK